MSYYINKLHNACALPAASILTRAGQDDKRIHIGCIKCYVTNICKVWRTMLVEWIKAFGSYVITINSFSQKYKRYNCIWVSLTKEQRN